jgi:2,3-dihydroxy-p-cumate/2,3-dihydroxybenzoate 3,4-dioxygenase
VKSIADELLYRERQFPFEPKGFCHWGANPQIRQFQGIEVERTTDHFAQ